MKRKASATWQGGLKDGKGTVSSDSGVLSNVAYSFEKRFGEEKGTNPEELIAAAHASCFAMATSAQLDGVGIKAQNIAATATMPAAAAATLDQRIMLFLLPASNARFLSTRLTIGNH